MQFSIIIPHHNIPNLLERLLNSIPNRTDLETIVIDDCSDNKYQEALRNIMTKFCNVKFILLPECKGGGHARNIGLSKAIGNYIIFADSDDFFLPSFDNILNSYSNVPENYDIIFFNAISLDVESFHLTSRHKFLDSLFDLYSKEPNKAKSYLKFLFGEPWCKIVNRNIISENNIRFDEIPINNDTSFSYQIGFYSNSISVDNRVGYVVTDRVNSVSKSLTEEKIIVRANIFAKKNRFLKDNRINIFDSQMIAIVLSQIRHKNWRLTKKIMSIYKAYGFAPSEIWLKVFRNLLDRRTIK